MTEEEEIIQTAEELQCSLEHARFVVAINRGIIDGDQVLIEPGEDVPDE